MVRDSVGGKIAMTTSASQKRKSNRRTGRIILLVILSAAVISYFTVPAVNSKVNSIVMIFSSMSVDNIIGFIRSYGVYAVLVSFLLMIFQSVAAPLPAFLLTFANAAIWGWWRGAILSWSSAMAGAIICFYIARLLGRDAVEKLTSKTAMNSIDVFFKRYGSNAILICRLLPFVSFDFVSYAAGLTAVTLGSFVLATGLGQLPATLVYSYVGGMLTGSIKTVVTALFVIFALFALTFLLKQMYNDKHKGDAA